MTEAAPATAPLRAGGWILLGRTALGIGLALGLLAVSLHVLEFVRGEYYADDGRQQTWPLLRDHDPALFADDYIADYYLDVYLPWGYRHVLGALARWIDPRIVAPALGYLLLLVTVLLTAAAARHLGGRTAAWGTAFLTLTCAFVFDREVGGLARSFGFPLISLGVWALLADRPRWLAIGTVLGGLFYPLTAVLLGLSLTVWMLSPQLVEARTGAAEGRPRGVATRRLPARLALLGLTGLLTVSAVVPTLLAARDYGPMLTLADSVDYPEAGVGGRYAEGDLPLLVDPITLITAKATLALRPIDGSGSLVPSLPAPPELLGVTLASGCLLVLGFHWMAQRRTAHARRLLLVAAVSAACYVIALLAAPYFFVPQRYFAFTLPVLVLIGLPAGLIWLLGLLAGDRLPQPARLGVAMSALVLLKLATGGIDRDGGLAGVDGTQRRVVDYVRTLPPSAMLAGWPTDLFSTYPVATARRALFTHENHMVFHKQYVEEMRRRMFAITDALVGGTHGAFERLRDEFGVTHVLVDDSVVRRGAPRYMPPFDDYAERRYAERVEWPPELRPKGAAEVFDAGGGLRVLDLSRLH